jgi:hypothetical protein
MLNRMDTISGNLATVRYTEADFHVLVPGTHVICAVTGKPIPLDELKYWNWQRQEAYIDAHASLRATQDGERP